MITTTIKLFSITFFNKRKKCKAIERIGSEQRQQLWNYMRLTRIRIGILYNFAPAHDQCERYYLDVKTDNMYAF